MRTEENIRLTKSLKSIDSWAKNKPTLNIDHITRYLESNDSFSMAADEFFSRGMAKIADAMHNTPHYGCKTKTVQLALGVLELLVSDAIMIERLRETNTTSFDDLDGITHVMFCAIATGQLSLIEPFHQAVFFGLNGGYGVGDGHNLPIGTTLRYAAFGLTIIGDWLGKPLDLDKHALPRDPAWGQLAAHWREPDPEKLLPILLDACDTHVERIALNSREVDSGNFEFGSPFEAVYPAEILAIKNLRHSLGLETPFIDHPLMKSPYAMLTLPPNTPLEHDELLEQFLKAACRYNPEAVPEGLYEAVREIGAIR